MLVLTLVGSFFATPRASMEQFPVPTNTVIVALVMVGACILLFLFTWVYSVLKFRKALASSTISEVESRHRFALDVVDRKRKRAALFFLTIMYLPVARAIFVMWKCTHSTGLLYVFESSPHKYKCVGSPETWLPIHWVAIIFALLYVLGIPIWFGLLIRTGVSEVLMHNAMVLNTVRERIAELKRELSETRDPVERKAKKKLLRKKKEVLKYQYKSAVREYIYPSSYLYRPYEEKNKYQKILQMFEKLIILAITLFVFTPSYPAVKYIAANGVILLFTAVDGISGPFLDNWEDLMHLCSRITNVLNVAVGILINRELLTSSSAQSAILVIVNGFNLLFMLFCSVAGPIVNYYRGKHAAKDDMIDRNKANQDADGRADLDSPDELEVGAAVRAAGAAGAVVVGGAIVYGADLIPATSATQRKASADTKAEAERIKYEVEHGLVAPANQAAAPASPNLKEPAGRAAPSVSPLPRGSTGSSGSAGGVELVEISLDQRQRPGISGNSSEEDISI